MKGESHPLFNNWSSFGEYGREFNIQFKTQIRERDEFTCMICGKKEKTKKLSIHHIDHNRKNTTKENCISLCEVCHGLTNYNKEIFKFAFQDMLNYLYKYDNLGSKMNTKIYSPKLNNYNEMETLIYNKEW
jgi:hypothetical protein